MLFRSPWPVIKRPHLWWKCLRDGITLERMHQAFDDGLMQYGMMTATKSLPPPPPPVVVAPVESVPETPAPAPIVA